MDDGFFAQRTGWEQAPNALTRTLDAFKDNGIEVLDLTESNPTHCDLTYPDGILNAFSDPANLVYAPHSQGVEKSRAAVAAYYEKAAGPLDPQDIFLTSSTSEAYSFILRLLVEPGQTVLIPRPSYPLFQFLLDINDATYQYYPLVFREGRWKLDKEALKALAAFQPKAIIVVNPNNPTGSYLDAGEIEFLNEFCLEHHMAIISDEVFSDYALGTETSSLLGNSAVPTFVLGGVSKTLALPQMKLSWIIPSGPQKVMREVKQRLDIIADTYLSVNTPVQNALPAWLKAAPKIQTPVLERLRHNLQFLKDAAMRVPGCEVFPVQGGWYAAVRLPLNGGYEDERVVAFLENDKVLVHPGYFFDFDGEDILVVSLLPRVEVFEEGVARILK